MTKQVKEVKPNEKGEYLIELFGTVYQLVPVKAEKPKNSKNKGE